MADSSTARERAASRRTRRRFSAGGAATLVAALSVVLAGGPAVAAPRDEQWYLDRIGVAGAHAAARGEGVTIGLLTRGAPVGHPDLGDAVLPTVKYQRKWLVSGAIEEAPAGVGPDDIWATGQIGLMAARGGAGLLGVAPAAKVRPVVCSEMIIEADRCVRWLVDSGVEVINLGDVIHGVATDDFDGIRYALAHDVVVVASLKQVRRWPESLTAGVLVAGGVDRAGQPVASSGTSPRVNVRAPGPDLVYEKEDRVVGLGRDGKHDRMSILEGDEIAAALVAGVVALVRSRYPDMAAPSVVNRVVATASERSGDAGMVDAAAAVTRDVPDVTANPLGDPGEPRGSSSPYRNLLLMLLTGPAILCVGVVVGIVLIIRRRRAPAHSPGQPHAPGMVATPSGPGGLR